MTSKLEQSSTIRQACEQCKDLFAGIDLMICELPKLSMLSILCCCFCFFVLKAGPGGFQNMAKGKTNPGIEHSKLIECFRFISIKQPLFNFNFIKTQSPLNL